MTKQKKALAVSSEAVSEMIFIIRGQKAMIDRDLAKLYGVATKRLNEQVKRNKHRFPEDFMFLLSPEEFDELVANCDRFRSLKHSTARPHVFTEQGVAMLSSVLNSERAIQVNIAIMRTFSRLREMVSGHKELAYKMRELERKVGRHDQEINVIIDVMKRLMREPERPKKGIGFHVK